MLHFVTSDHRIAAVDVQEATKKIIPLPAMPEEKSWPEPGYVAQSQGKLHYINKKYDDGLFIWVLEDYGARAWVLKHSVSFKELFGQNSRTWRKNDYSVVAMHPDGNVVFIVQDWNLKLVSYQMDRKPVSVIGTLDNQMDLSDIQGRIRRASSSSATSLASESQLPATPSPATDGTMESGLPEDPLVEIISRLLAKSICRSKCVSKPWCDLIADVIHRKRLPRTLQGFIYSDGGAHVRENYGRFIDPLGRPVPLIDPLFTFLTKQPGVENIILLGSCNGLLLFGHRRVSDIFDSLGYIVCNPATEQWVAVPSSGWSPWPDSETEDEDKEYFTEADVLTHLFFDPAVSTHFQLVQLLQESYMKLAGVYTYSSETGVWRSNDEVDWEQWGFDAIIRNVVGLPFNGMLHLKVDEFYERQSIIVAVDGDGKTSRIIRWIEKRGFPDFVGESHGNLYCVSRDLDDSYMVTELSIWVLEDYHTEEWVLRHSVSILQLFGEISCHFATCKVVTIHPDCNLVFIVYDDYKLVSYNMDSKEVCDVCTLGLGYGRITPYVPYFSDLPVLENKH
ncbi:hypothetical protein HU200_014361 [Digitaria exilis]|uniref:F-box domain-containing protein n=1 Tax=Digitaria exilis TaxID=1010633 RepID=A0A835FC09_9POAL|nr:hypothetical protein HU200_014361 [Digitaria exilis]